MDLEWLTLSHSIYEVLIMNAQCLLAWFYFGSRPRRWWGEERLNTRAQWSHKQMSQTPPDTGAGRIMNFD
jgi:hypothetical protein